MRRRDFIAGVIVGLTTAWPLAVRAQPPERIRRIGVLHTPAADHRKARRVARRSCRAAARAGPTAAMCGSIPAEPQAMPTGFADTWRNQLRSRRTILATGSAPSGRCCRRIAPCRSCSRVSRSGRQRIRREFGAAGRQRHWFYRF